MALFGHVGRGGKRGEGSIKYKNMQADLLSPGAAVRSWFYGQNFEYFYRFPPPSTRFFFKTAPLVKIIVSRIYMYSGERATLAPNTLAPRRQSLIG